MAFIARHFGALHAFNAWLLVILFEAYKRGYNARISRG